MKNSSRKFYRFDKLRSVLTKKFKTEAEHMSFTFQNTPLKNKFILGDDKNSFHYTVLFDEYKQVLDIHKKNHKAGLPIYYEPLFKLPFNQIENLWLKLSLQSHSILEKYITLLSFNEFRTENIWLLPIQSERIAAKLIDVRRKNRFRVVETIHPRHFDNWIKYPDELTKEDGQIFLAFNPNNKFDGFTGLTIRTDDGNNFYCLSVEALDGFFKAVGNILEDLMLIKSLTKKVLNRNI